MPTPLFIGSSINERPNIKQHFILAPTKAERDIIIKDALDRLGIKDTKGLRFDFEPAQLIIIKSA